MDKKHLFLSRASFFTAWINMKHDSLEEQQIGPNSSNFVSFYTLHHLS